ncbi:hypothetical protein C8J56DRAFT_900478 [Mycena floridula]|nr:hypothetical protein C8J56DRAFT_900478 [Mycena floridula]
MPVYNQWARGHPFRWQIRVCLSLLSLNTESAGQILLILEALPSLAAFQAPTLVKLQLYVGQDDDSYSDKVPTRLTEKSKPGKFRHYVPSFWADLLLTYTGEALLQYHQFKFTDQICNKSAAANLKTAQSQILEELLLLGTNESTVFFLRTFLSVFIRECKYCVRIVRISPSFEILSICVISRFDKPDGQAFHFFKIYQFGFIIKRRS